MSDGHELAPPRIVEVIGGESLITADMARIVYDRWNPDGLVACAPTFDDFARNGVPRALMNLLLPGWWMLVTHFEVEGRWAEHAEEAAERECVVLDSSRFTRTGWRCDSVRRRSDGKWDAVATVLPPGADGATVPKARTHPV